MAGCSFVLSCVALVCRRLSGQPMSDTNLSDPRLPETQMSDARLSGPRRPRVPKAYAGRADPGPQGGEVSVPSAYDPQAAELPSVGISQAGRADPGPQGGLGPIRVGAGPPKGAQALRSACKSRLPEARSHLDPRRTPLRRAPRGCPGPTQGVQIQAPKGEVPVGYA